MASKKLAGVLLVALLLVPPMIRGHGGTGTATRDEVEGLDMVPISNRTLYPDALGGHGAELVFASPTDDWTGVGLWLLDTATGQEELLTRIRIPVHKISFDSMDYDGRYVAWSDNRTGNLQVYVLDTRDRSFRALTDSSSDERQVSIHNGTVVWATWGNFTTNAFDLDSDRRFTVGFGGGAGPAAAPDIWNDRVVWSVSLGGTNFEAIYRNLTTGRLDRLSFDEDVQATPKIWKHLVVWAEGPLPENPNIQGIGNGSEEVKGSRIVARDLRTNQTIPLTPTYGPFKNPVVADEWVAWQIRQKGISLYNLTNGNSLVMPAPPKSTPDVVLTEDLLAFSLRGVEGLQLYADAPHHLMEARSTTQSQGQGGSGGLGPSWLMAGAGVLLIGGGLGIESWRRNRANQDEDT